MKLNDDTKYLQSQLITYIGNKRALLDFIGSSVQIVQNSLGRDKLYCLDIFAGSGIVSRYLKQYSAAITANDLEKYSYIINQCYLTDKSKIETKTFRNLYKKVTESIQKKMDEIEHNGRYKDSGFISELYAPADEKKIRKEERCFYTPYNAAFIDIARQTIESEVPENLKHFFIAPLLSEASVHANTSGVFKGFYKNSQTKTGQFGGNGQNALTRIMGKIELPFPVLSDFDCRSRVFNNDANALVLDEKLYAEDFTKDGLFDLAYFDPPYNQHPYGSNYFMLNLIAEYQKPDEEKISVVSGIPRNWNRSLYNKKRQIQEVFYNLVKNVRARFVLVSFNSEGYISRDEMISLLSKCGKVQVLESDYNTFRGSRNLNAHGLYLKEFLFLVDKR